MSRHEVGTRFDPDEPVPKKAAVDRASIGCCMTEHCVPDNTIGSGVIAVASGRGPAALTTFTGRRRSDG